jgi:hypothetical protein
VKQLNTLKQVMFILLVAFIILACSGGALAATATPIPTDTVTPAPTNTATPTPRPTKTPTPTATLVPTPAPVGEAVRSSSYEVTVLSAKEIRRVYMGSYYYYPLTGYTYLEAVVRASNLGAGKANVKWKYIYVTEEDGNGWYPYWGGFKAVDTGVKVDGSSISVDEITDGESAVEFEQDVVLRLIWILTKNGQTAPTVLFGFDDAPNVQIVVK